VKEKKIDLRDGLIEKEKMGIRKEMERIKKENIIIREKI
jgi:hypothetical protein